MVFMTRKPLILASGSPRRKRYFEDLGLTFAVCTADVVETQRPGEHPDAFVIRMAEEKARVVMGEYPKSWVVAADTVVIHRDVVLGKPKDREEAVKILMRLSGEEHSVRTGFCIGCLNENERVLDCVATRVVFDDFSEDVARAYVATGEPLDKAGAYGIQGRGAFLVATVTGSYSNVVGLPLREVIAYLRQYGVISPILC